MAALPISITRVYQHIHHPTSPQAPPSITRPAPPNYPSPPHTCYFSSSTLAHSPPPPPFRTLSLAVAGTAPEVGRSWNSESSAPQLAAAAQAAACTWGQLGLALQYCERHAGRRWEGGAPAAAGSALRRPNLIMDGRPDGWIRPTATAAATGAAAGGGAAEGVDGAGGGTGTATGAAAPAVTSKSSSYKSAPTSTVAPSSAKRATSLPAVSARTSTVTLSVSISISTSFTATTSPTAFVSLRSWLLL